MLAHNKNLFYIKINDSEYVLFFVNFEQAMEFDEFIKTKLVSEGFHKEYNPNKLD
jgi:hypothetical protein